MRPDFTDADREWLHQLVTDWQVIADLSFADLLLILPMPDGRYVVADQCRPSTVMTLRSEDVVGKEVDRELYGELDAAMHATSIFRSTVMRSIGKSTVCNVYAPVRHEGKTLGLVVRETNMATRESNGRYESESINAGKQLYEMIPRGRFPYHDPVMNQRHNARVADGFIILTVDGIVRYASPNAVSCFRRLGSLTTMQGQYLSEVGTQLLHTNDTFPESLPLVLSGKAAVDSELEANRSAVSMRSLPLYDANGRTGAIVLCRDVTELRRRDVELQTKDATISEIHHRVKNNLQILNSFLNLEKRIYKNDPNIIIEHMQTRLTSLALLHEKTYNSRNFKNINLKEYLMDHDRQTERMIDLPVEVEFETCVDEDLNLTIEVITPLLLIIDELTMNAIKHAFPDKTAPNKKIIKEITEADDNTATLIIRDNGVGIKDPKSISKNLGCEIVKSLTKQLGGNINLIETENGTAYRLIFPIEMEHTMN